MNDRNWSSYAIPVAAVIAVPTGWMTLCYLSGVQSPHWARCLLVSLVGGLMLGGAVSRRILGAGPFGGFFKPAMLFCSLVWPLLIVLYALGSSGSVDEPPKDNAQRQTEVDSGRDTDLTGKDSPRKPEAKKVIPPSRADIVKWLNEARIVPSDNGWEQVPRMGTHHSRGKYGPEFITNCSLLGDCVIEIKALAGRSGLTSLGPRGYNGRILLLDQEKPLKGQYGRKDKEIVEYTSSTQKIEVTGALLLYLWRRPSEGDQYRGTPLDFTWKLAENRSKEVVRKAFKRDFRPKAGHEESCDFAILPFQLPALDGDVPIRTQFDICVTFTRLTPNKPEPAADSPKPDQDILDALPSVIKMVTVVKDKEDEREIFSDEYVVANIWRISSEEIRDRWLNPDEYKLGKLIVVVRQPLTVHIAYCVRGERW